MGSLLNMSSGSLLNKALPYDAEAEFLQNPVGGFIRLSYKPSNNTGYEVRWCKADSQNLARAPLGCWKGWQSNMWGEEFKQLEAAEKQLLTCWGNHYWIFNSSDYPATNFVTWRRVGPTFYYNGSRVATNAPNTFQSDIDIFLFGLNINERLAFNNPIKLGYCKIFDSSTNELFFDLIPVRKGNIGYMYDKVSKKLYGNNGTGDFILGPDK